MSAIVTGGTRGIGLGIARALVADGRRVTITGRDRRRVDDAMRQLGAAADRLAGEVVDVRDREAVDRLVAGAVSRFGKVDVLVNNAGVGAFAPVGDMSIDDWHTVIDTNLTAVFYCTKAALPHLRKSGNAYIVNISSLAGKNWFAGGAAYCASKAGLNAFSEALMQDVRQHDIRVSYVMPGSVNTEFNFRGAVQADWKLTGDDIAQVVLDLVRSDKRALASRVEIRPSKPR